MKGCRGCSKHSFTGVVLGDMKILITGAHGYLGSLLCAELRPKYEVVGTSRHGALNAEVVPLDIRAAELVTATFAALTPDVIIHAAAITNVASCEKNPTETFKTNAEGSLNIARAANEIGAKVIFISSLAARDPLKVYGKSKQAAENYIRTVRAGYEILQLSMTFGLSPNTTNNRPFNKIISTMQTGSPQVYDNFWRFQPTHTDHLLSIINRLLEQPFAGRCLAVTTVETCTMYQIASDVLNPTLVQGEHLYYGRSEQLIDSDHLPRLGFPAWSYSSMVKILREHLAEFH